MPPKKAMRIPASYRAAFMLKRVARAYIGLGSNLGDREGTLLRAMEELARLGAIVARSSLYETSPVDFHEQPLFLNGVMALDTEMEPRALLRELLAIERRLGRDRGVGPAKGPRTLDLDLLIVDDCVMREAELALPHPALAQRRFVLAPLAEVAPLLRPPTCSKTVSELLAELEDEGDNSISAVRKLDRKLSPLP